MTDSKSTSTLTLKVMKAKHGPVAIQTDFDYNSPCEKLDRLLEASSSDDDTSPSSPYSGTPEQDGSTSSRRCIEVRTHSEGCGAVKRCPTPRMAPIKSRSNSVDLDPTVRYQIISEIRKSLFGTVVHAWDTIRHQDVAIKLSNTDLALAGVCLTGYSVMENPLSEAVLLKELPAHPFIVSLRREHIVDNVHWAVMEYMPNGDLFEHLLHSICLTPRAARTYVRQIAQALLHLHSHKVCHLDVSLENVLLDLRANVKLTDFGVARSFAHQDSSVFPGIDGPEKPGKVRYMAPEMLAGKSFDGCLVDSFALGVIMFCLLVGSAPFERARIKDTRWQFVATGNFAGLFEYLGVPSPSASAVDLLKGLLTTADKRLTMAAVLRHPWFSERLV